MPTTHSRTLSGSCSEAFVFTWLTLWVVIIECHFPEISDKKKASKHDPCGSSPSGGPQACPRNKVRLSRAQCWVFSTSLHSGSPTCSWNSYALQTLDRSLVKGMLTYLPGGNQGRCLCSGPCSLLRILSNIFVVTHLQHAPETLHDALSEYNPLMSRLSQEALKVSKWFFCGRVAVFALIDLKLWGSPLWLCCVPTSLRWTHQSHRRSAEKFSPRDGPKEKNVQRN